MYSAIGFEAAGLAIETLLPNKQRGKLFAVMIWTSGPAEVLLSSLNLHRSKMSAAIQSFRSSYHRYMSVSIMARAFPKTIHKNNERVALASRKEKRISDLRSTAPTPINAELSSA